MPAAGETAADPVRPRRSSTSTNGRTSRLLARGNLLPVLLQRPRDQFARLREQHVDFRRVLAASFCEVSSAATATADNRGELLHQLSSLDAVGQVLRYRDQQLDLAIVFGGEHDYASPEAVSQRIGEATQRALFESDDAPCDQFDVSDR